MDDEMTEAADQAFSRSCSDCVHFVFDGRHPLHARLCDRLGGRLLSADAERASGGKSCGPEARAFTLRDVSVSQ